MTIDLNTAPLSMDKTGLKKNALAGEVAVVTGGTSNIGLATARSLAWLGAKVVIAARSPERGAAAAEFINKENKPGTALFVSTDISSEASIKAMAQKAFDAFGKVDILVNNAMDMSLAAPILSSTIQQLDQQYEIAVRGTMLCIQAFAPGMQQRRHGVIAYVSTLFCYPAGPSNYCALKAAGVSLTLSVANELGPVKDSGIAVFTYIPGLVHRAAPGEVKKAVGFVPPPAMPGYPGPYPPEDCGAAFAYSIVHAAEIHGSGIIITQAFEQMNWPYPKPETASKKDFDRIRDLMEMRMFGYLGPGFPKKRLPLVTINRSETQPHGEMDKEDLK
jgi:NAD(P)-dependent dehydrogenase (short-subunit alcohol dehydrogenase family)